MTPDLDSIRTALNTSAPWLIPAIAGVTAIAGIIGLIFVLRYLRRQDGGIKQTVGTAVVQTIVAFVILTGVYAFCATKLHMPFLEALISSVGIMSCVWAGAGRIISYGKKPETVGWGPSGPFFWASVFGGGILAVLGSASGAVEIGRAVLVILDAWLWALQFGSVTRKNPNSRWRWTPNRFLVAIGARAAADDDRNEDPRRVRVARIARAMRRENSIWPFSWLGRRTLERLGDVTPEDVVAEALRRLASGKVLVAAGRDDSEVMGRAVAAVLESQTAAVLVAPVIEAPPARRVKQEDPPGDPGDPPVGVWQEQIDRRQDDPTTPVSPAVGGPAGLTDEQQIAKWRVDYASAIAHVKAMWVDPRSGLDWKTAIDPPSGNNIVLIQKASGIDRWTSKETARKIQAVIIGDRKDAADADTGE